MDKILDLLKYITNFGYEAYIVGGFVRDKLLNRDSFDVDICTSAKPDELKIILPKIKELDLFCSSLTLDEYDIQITSYRIESDYNGRRPLKVEYASRLIDDLNRRDFTINTICIDKDGQIIDLLDGVKDLKNKKIRCVLDANKKIEEDTLRILRAIRFASTLNFSLDRELISAIKKHKEDLEFLSAFRKRQELDKIVLSGGLNIIKELNIEKELGIIVSDNINICDDIIGIYAQCDVQIDCFFKREELKKYEKLKLYYLKDLTDYDLFILGEEYVSVLSQMRNENLIDKYNNLCIHNINELDIDLNLLKNNNIKEKIIKSILDGSLKNKDTSILKFINNNF